MNLEGGRPGCRRTGLQGKPSIARGRHRINHLASGINRQDLLHFKDLDRFVRSNESYLRNKARVAAVLGYSNFVQGPGRKTPSL